MDCSDRTHAYGRAYRLGAARSDRIWNQVGLQPCERFEEGQNLRMRIVVDLNRCQGYAQCVFLAPKVFELHGEEALSYRPAVGEDQGRRVRRAAAACPVQAILVEDTGDGSHVR